MSEIQFEVVQVVITVVDASDSSPVRDVLVSVSNAYGEVDAAYVNELGTVAFELAPDHYEVSIDGQPGRPVDLAPGATEAVRVAVDGEDS